MRSNEREGVWAAFVPQPAEGRAHFHIENQDFSVKPEPIGKKREPDLLTCEREWARIDHKPLIVRPLLRIIRRKSERFSLSSFANHSHCNPRTVQE
jgi:hypothetical protein